MSTFKINGKTIKTNLSPFNAYEIGKPIISYPYSFTSDIRKIKQDFIVGANNVPTFNPNARHSIYPNARLIEQTHGEASPVGFCQFSRTYFDFSANSVQFPTTISYTFPSLYRGFNYKGRDIEIDQDDASTLIQGSVGDPIRKNPITLTIPVNQIWEIIDVSESSTDPLVSASNWQIGDSISYQENSWIISQNDNGVINATRIDSEGNLVSSVIDASTSSTSSFNYQSSIPDFNKIEITPEFAVLDNYFGVYRSNSALTKVDFVDSRTIPSYSEYVNLVEDEESYPLQASTIEHIGGYIYLKKTNYGQLQ